MTPEQQTVRQKWVAALRSGKYKQGKNVLCNVNPETKEKSYCCLGVLCELYAETHSINKVEMSDTIRGEDTFIHIGYVTSEYFAFLPLCVQEWAGLYSDAGDSSDCKSSLSAMNDYEIGGPTFNELADIIESDDSYFN